jgi:hypothetical protein
LKGEIDVMGAVLDSELERIRKKEEEEMVSLGFGEGDEEIIEGKGHGLDPQLIESIKESLNEPSRQIDFGQIVNHPNFDARSFLNYVLEAHTFEREELLELKRKISSLKSKETLANIKHLTENKPNIVELFNKSKDVVPGGVEVEQFIEAIAETAQPK